MLHDWRGKVTKKNIVQENMARFTHILNWRCLCLSAWALQQRRKLNNKKKGLGHKFPCELSLQLNM